MVFGLFTAVKLIGQAFRLSESSGVLF